MSEGMNRMLAIGNISQEPKFKKFGTGSGCVLNLSVACSEKYVDRNNTMQEKTEFVNVTVWGPEAETLSTKLAKGDRVFADGQLKTHSYDKNGEKRYQTSLVAKTVLLMAEGRGRAAAAARAQMDESDEIPF